MMRPCGPETLRHHKALLERYHRATNTAHHLINDPFPERRYRRLGVTALVSLLLTFGALTVSDELVFVGLLCLLLTTIAMISAATYVAPIPKDSHMSHAGQTFGWLRLPMATMLESVYPDHDEEAAIAWDEVFEGHLEPLEECVRLFALRDLTPVDTSSS